jgi:hypothetical protein
MEYIDILDELPFVPYVKHPIIKNEEQIKSSSNFIVRPDNSPIVEQRTDSSSKAFIEANTIECSLSEIQQQHIIPVWMKDNEPLISTADFIQTVSLVTMDVFHGEHILHPSVRVSHPIKGRIPSAKDKPAHLLNDDEKTLYYERMMFCIEIPSIQSNVEGNQLSLMVGGVKSYGEDNLYQRSGGDQHFKIFIGFKNSVCTNLCVWSDGYNGNLAVKNKEDLQLAIQLLLQRYNSSQHLEQMKQLSDYSIKEQQFAQLVGRCRMYQYLPAGIKQSIPPLLFGENQMGAVVKDFYRDNNFSKESNGSIDLWRLYNLFTGVNKSSYIDTFLDRSVNAYNFVDQIQRSLDGSLNNWYLN